MVETMLELSDKARNIEFCFENLERVVTLSRKKMDMETVANADRQRWARILVSAIEVYGRLLEGKELGEILDILENKTKAGERFEQV